MAEKNGVHAGWSNPCCDRFADKFEKVTGQKYYKNDRDVYGKLVQYGDFGQAVVLAERSLKKCVDDGKKQPSGIWLLNAFCGNCDKCGEGNASDKFWALEKKIRENRKDCGVQ